MEILTGFNPMSLKSPWVDSNYFIGELMMLITDKYQDNEWPMKVACNLMVNLKLDKVITRNELICKPSDSLMNPK